MEMAGRAIARNDTLLRPLLPCVAALLFCPVLLAGCKANSLRQRREFRQTQDPYCTLMPAADSAGTLFGNLVHAQAGFAAGVRQEERECQGCVELYYRAAIDAWRHMESMPRAPSSTPDGLAAWQTYQQSVGRLVTTARRFGRLDPRGRLILGDGAGRRSVPIEYYGFAWKPYEFCEVLPACDLPRKDIEHDYRSCGIGVSLVGVRRGCGQEMFYRPRQPFAVTAVLRPRGSIERSGDASPAPPQAVQQEAVLAFYNPCSLGAIQVGPSCVPLARDLSAPFAYLLRESPRKFTEGFLDPDAASVKPQLILMEPYQHGKVPVVFIHGIWSDPMTWADTINELRAQGDLYRTCQFWFFQYPTGGELLQSAAELREKLLLAREQFDPQHQDCALEQMVLVGHSMGGLVAQLQVTCSSDVLWRHAANRPLEEVRTTPQMREQLQRMFFFGPSPLVKRVVFIATPHRGSGMSRRLIGRVAAGLVRYSGPEKAQYEQLMDGNRDIFKQYLWKSRPTTIDLLEPDNPMLAAMARMSFGCGVRTHSIIGTGRRTLAGEPSDGVVPVSSARQAGDCSELHVSARHDKLHRDPATVAELTRILREHVLRAKTREF
jgi:pimeloyl-ACP methyl ester carboxylesterase